MSANFLVSGLLAGFIGGLGFNGTFDALIDGMKSILFGALIVGFAKAIVVVLEDGKIIDTIVFYLTNSIQDLPASITVGTMFIIQLFLNLDRKSTRLNSSHVSISYAVFCLKKKI